jgi:radical SAM protein with 4Fe4S-binding SPASM domain
VLQKTAEMLMPEDLERIADLYSPDKVSVLGGEPLLYPFLPMVFELFEHVSLNTNGLLVGERLDLLERAEAVFLSLEGYGRTNDEVRGRGVFKRVLRAARLLKEREVKVVLRVSYWEGNLGDVPKLFGLAEKVADGMSLFPRLDKPPLSIEQQIWLFTEVSKHENSWVDVPSFWVYTGLNRDAYCPAGSKRFAVDNRGIIHPCQWQLDYYLGRVGDDWGLVQDNARAYLEHVKRPAGACLGCPSAAMCRSSCMAARDYLACPLLAGIRIEHVYREGLPQFKPEVRRASLKSFLRNIVSC